jgi:hypothetical protein
MLYSCHWLQIIIKLSWRHYVILAGKVWIWNEIQCKFKRSTIDSETCLNRASWHQTTSVMFIQVKLSKISYIVTLKGSLHWNDQTYNVGSNRRCSDTLPKSHFNTAYATNLLNVSLKFTHSQTCFSNHLY